jgi:GntR family transcriptional regulator
VSQGTVRKAVDDMAADNLLVRRQGKGTFVATHQESRAQFRFLRLRPNQGPVLSPESHIVDCRRMRMPADIARVLNVRTGDPCLQIIRQMGFAGKPVIYDEIWLPGPSFRGLTLERLRAYQGPLYAFFEAEFGTRMIRCEERVQAVGLPAEASPYLALAANTPVLQVERLSLTYGDQACEFRRSWYATPDHHYFSEFV